MIPKSKFEIRNSKIRQDTPADMIDRLLATIRGQFCGDMDDKKWFSTQDWFKRYVVLWPARFMNKRGFTIPAARYESIMREIFTGIKQHAGAVRDWHGYLLKCVQDHWHHNWEDYYRESKSARHLAESTLAHLGKLSPPEDRTVETLAQAQAVIARKMRRARVKSPLQPDLFKGV